MQEICIFSTKTCPNCKILKDILNKENIQYKDINMATPEAMTELRMNNIYAMSAPILQIGDKFYTTKELCLQDTINQYAVKNIIKML